MITLNKKKNQNSDRDARPEKTAYLRKQVTTASVKLRDGGIFVKPISIY
jgi:hypothetical protein